MTHIVNTLVAQYYMDVLAKYIKFPVNHQAYMFSFKWQVLSNATFQTSHQISANTKTRLPFSV